MIFHLAMFAESRFSIKMVRRVKINRKNGENIFIHEDSFSYADAEELKEIKKYHRDQKKKNLKKMIERFSKDKDIWSGK